MSDFTPFEGHSPTRIASSCVYFLNVFISFSICVITKNVRLKAERRSRFGDKDKNKPSSRNRQKTAFFFSMMQNKKRRKTSDWLECRVNWQPTVIEFKKRQ